MTAPGLRDDSQSRSGTRRLGRLMAGLGLVLLAAAVAVPAQAQVTTLVSNHGEDDTSATNVVHAQRFKTGSNANGYTISEIQIRLGSGSGSTSVLLRNNSSSRPGGTVVASFTNPDSLTSDAVNTFTASSAVPLARGTLYWVVVNEGVSGTRRSIGTTNGDGETGEAGWSLDNDRVWSNTPSLGSWETGSFAMQVAIRGTAVAASTPPSTDATLSGLTLSKTSLDPTFDGATTSYTASVLAPVRRITVTPTPTDPDATVAYLDGDDAALDDADANTAGHQVRLAPGENTIKVKVTAEDGTAGEPYTVVVTRATASPGLGIEGDEDDLQIFQLGGDTHFGFVVGEGDSYTYTVVLTAPPTAPVTVTVAPDDTDIVTVDKTSLQFTPETWDDPQSVRVTAPENRRAGDDEHTAINHTASGGDYTGIAKTVLTLVLNNDAPSTDATLSGLTLSDGTLDFVSGTKDYRATVANSVQQITVTPTHDDGATVAYLDEYDVAIPDADTGTTAWDVALDVGANTIKVRVTAEDGTAGEPYTVVVTRATASPGLGIEGDEDDLQIFQLGGVLHHGFLVGEGGSYTYTVVLTAPPTAPVTVTVAPEDTDIATVDKTSLQFTPETWADPQSVRMTAPENRRAGDDEETVINHTASGGDYAGIVETLVVRVANNDVLPPATLPTMPTGDTYVSNLGQALSSTHVELPVNGSQWISFRTGASESGYHSLGSAVVRFSQRLSSAGPLVVTIGKSRGNVEYTLRNPPNINSLHLDIGELTFWAPVGARLDADRTYWLGFRQVGGVVRGWKIRSTDSNSEDSGKAAGWSIGNSRYYQSPGVNLSSTSRRLPKFAILSATDTATLSNLELSDQGGITPAFDPETTYYSGVTPTDNSQVKLTATPAGGAVLEIQNAEGEALPDADSETAGFQVHLLPGDNTFLVKVTSLDETITNTYTVVAKRTPDTTGDLADCAAPTLPARERLIWEGLLTAGGSGVYSGYRRLATPSADFGTLDRDTFESSGETYRFRRIEFKDDNQRNFSVHLETALSAGSFASLRLYVCDKPAWFGGSAATPTAGTTWYQYEFSGSGIRTSSGDQYRLYITEDPSESQDASLESLALSSGALSPGFNPETTSYTANVGYGVSEVTVTPTPAGVGATVEWINAAGGTLADADSATDGFQFDLPHPGPFTVRFRVRSPDGTRTSQTYVVRVSRSSASATQCKTPDLRNGTLIWWGSVDGEYLPRDFAGAIPTRVGYTDSPNQNFGGLNNKTFTIPGGNSFTVSEIAQGRGRLYLGVNPALSTSDKEGLFFFDCDRPHTVESKSTTALWDSRQGYIWERPGGFRDLFRHDYYLVKATDATLRTLAVNDGTRDVALSPGFDPDRETYTVPVSIHRPQVTVRAGSSWRHADIEYQDASGDELDDADDEVAGFQVALSLGPRTVKIEVTVTPTSTKTYTLNITRVQSAGCVVPDFGISKRLLQGLLTVGDVAGGGRGFDGQAGELDHGEFTVAPTDYAIEAVTVSTAGALSLALDKPLTAGDKSELVFYVCGRRFGLADAEAGAGNTYTWAGAGLDWSAAASVDLFLTLQSDATLSGLTVNDGTSDVPLFPPFSPFTTVMTASLASGVAQVTVTATPKTAGTALAWRDAAGNVIADADASAPGHQFDPGPLSEGRLFIKVTGRDGRAKQTYRLTLARRDAGCALPDFGQETLIWRATLSLGTGGANGLDRGYFTSVGLSPAEFRIGEQNKTVTGIESQHTDNGGNFVFTTNPSLSVADRVGLALYVCAEKLDFADTQQGGTTWAVHNVDWSGDSSDVVLHLTKDLGGTLSGLALNDGEEELLGLTPGFDPFVDEYVIGAPIGVTRVTVTPTVPPGYEDATAVEHLDGAGNPRADADSAAEGHQVDLGIGATTTIKVKATTGEVATTYKVDILRLLDPDCAAPDFDKSRRVWQEVLTVGDVPQSGRGFGSGAGRLNDSTFAVDGRDYAIEAVTVSATGALTLTLDKPLVADDRKAAVFHPCAASFELAAATEAGNTYTWTDADLDWTSRASVDLRVSEKYDQALAGLVLKDGADAVLLYPPAFDPEILSYTATVGGDVTKVTVKGTANDPSAVVHVEDADGDPLPDADLTLDGRQVALTAAATTTIKVRVTVGSLSSATYTVEVTRPDAACAAPDLGGARPLWTGMVDVATLRNVGRPVGYGYRVGSLVSTFNGGGLDNPSFSIGTTEYTIRTLLREAVHTSASTVPIDERFILRTSPALSSGNRQTLVLYACDKKLALSAGNAADNLAAATWGTSRDLVTWTKTQAAGIDWSDADLRTVRLVNEVAAELSGLALSEGGRDVPLDAPFDSEAEMFHATLTDSDVTQITVTPATDVAATVAYTDEDDGALSDADPDTSGHQLDLDGDLTKFKIKVTAAGAVTPTVYELRVSRPGSACAASDFGNAAPLWQGVLVVGKSQEGLVFNGFRDGEYGHLSKHSFSIGQRNFRIVRLYENNNVAGKIFFSTRPHLTGDDLDRLVLVICDTPIPLGDFGSLGGFTSGDLTKGNAGFDITSNMRGRGLRVYLAREGGAATLSGLAVKTGAGDVALSRAFRPGRTSYTASVGEVSQATVTPTKSDGTATIEWQDGGRNSLSDADAGMAGFQVALAEHSSRVVRIKVRSGNGRAGETYTLTLDTRIVCPGDICAPTLEIGGGGIVASWRDTARQVTDFRIQWQEASKPWNTWRDHGGTAQVVAYEYRIESLSDPCAPGDYPQALKKTTPDTPRYSELTKRCGNPLRAGTAYKVRVRWRSDEGRAPGRTRVRSGPWSAEATIAMPSEQRAQQPDGSLTASFVGLPASHGGDPFTFELAFNEDVALGWQAVRDNVFDVTGGAVSHAERAEQGSGRRWAVTVEPDGWEDVTIALPPTGDCEAAGAVCTADGRKLSNGIGATILGPPVLRVADAEVDEGPEAVLEFAVTLSRAAFGTVTVDYATADGTATAGADYTAATGTLSFAPGELQKTVSVAVLDDAHDEGTETLTLTLANPQGARIADGEATGSIKNTDSMPRAWLARFGRTVADQVIDAVQARLTAPPRPGVEVALAGQRIGGPTGSGTGAAEPEDGDSRAALADEAEARSRLEAMSRWLRGGTGEDVGGAGFGARAVTERELLTGTSFSLTGEAGASGGGTAALWGRGAVSRFDGREGELTLDGEVTSAMLGADWTGGPGSGSGAGAWAAGLLVSHSRGDGGYRAPSGEGRVSSTLTGVYPYGRHALNDRVTLWGVAGYGAGSLTLTPKNPVAGEDDRPIETDMDLVMGALGLRGVLVEAPAEGGPELAVKSDALAVRTTSEKTAGLAAATADVTRVRLGLEGTWRGLEVGSGTLTPSLEVGVRHDGGDAETGFGLDLGAGLALSDTKRGLQAEIRARGLLSHESKGFRERGVSGSLAWNQKPGSDRGATLTLSQTLGGASSGGADALLARTTLDGLAANDNGGGGDLESRRLELKLGYGLSAFGDGFTWTPEAGFGLSDTGRDYSLGWRLVRRSSAGDIGALELAFEATRRESANDDAPAGHAVGLRLTARW